MKCYTKCKTHSAHKVTVNILKLSPFTPVEDISYLAAIPEQVFCSREKEPSPALP